MGMSVTRKRLIRVSVYGPLAFVILLMLAHPYSRQCLFGPKIDGVPLRYWQDNLRAHADRERVPDTLPMKIVRWLGLNHTENLGGVPVDRTSLLTVLLSLMDDPNPRVRFHVAALLGYSGLSADDCGPPLLRLLDDGDAAVRVAALAALGNNAPRNIPPAAVPSLVKHLEDVDPHCRIRAAELLWHMGERNGSEMVRLLRPALQDPDANVRGMAVLILGRVGRDTIDAFADVAALATADADTRVRSIAAETLEKFGPPAIPVLMKMLHDPQSRCRQAAADALGTMGRDAMDCVPALEVLQNDANLGVRDAAAKALEHIDPERFPPAAAKE
jgi:HEAT repeat protein